MLFSFIYIYRYGICLITSCFWQLGLQGRAISSRTADAVVYSLWSLLPSFCNYPFDMAESFKDLEKALCSALHEEPETRGVICSSLQILIQQNKKILEEKGEMPDIEEGIARQRAVARYTPQVAAKNMSELKSSAYELLKVLSGVLVQSKTDDGGSLQVLKPSQSIENAATVHLGCWHIDLILIL
jgi:ribosomal RNA-processing protein 12